MNDKDPLTERELVNDTRRGLARPNGSCGERDTMDPLGREPDPIVYLSHTLSLSHSL